MRKVFHIALLISFLLTIFVPLTGVQIHKMASVVFLLLSIAHTLIYRKKMGAKKYLLLGVILLSFASGLFSMIWDHIPIILILHRAISIAVVFFTAIHIFVYHRKFNRHTTKEKNAISV